MQQEDFIVQAIQSATVQVFSTMLEKSLVCGTPYLEPREAEAAEGVIAQICVVGASSITCLVCCSAAMACDIAGTLLMQKCSAVDAEVLDAMAEIANMVLGSVKTDLHAHLGDVNLSIPTVTYGSHFMVHSHSKRWILVPFQMDAERLVVKVCIEPLYEPRRPHSGRREAAA